MRKASVGLAVIIGVLGLSLLARIPLLNGSFWLDEAAQALESSRPLHQQLQIRDDFQPPFIHLLIFGLMQVSRQEAWLRFGAALLPGLITIWMTIKIGEKLFSTRTAWLAAILLGTSSFHIFYSQELRPYSLPAMFATLSWLLVILIADNWLKKRKNQSSTYIGWVIFSSFGLYSSYLYPFVFLSQLAWLGWNYHKQSRELKLFLISSFGVLLSFIPWLPSFLDQLQAGQQLRMALPGWQSVVSFSQFKSLALVGGKFIYGVLDLSKDPFFLISGVVVIASTGWLVFHSRKQLLETKYQTLFFWGVLPIVLAWVVSFWVPILQPKRVLFALPAFYLFLSSLIDRNIEKPHSVLSKITAYILGLILLGINLFSTFSYYTQPKYQREDWRGVHQFITQKYPTQESVVIFAFPNQFAPWDWYNRSAQFPTRSTGVFVISSDEASPERQALKDLTRFQYILVFDYLRDLTDPDRVIEQDLERYGYEEVDQIVPNTPLGIIRVYARAGQILSYSKH